MKLVKGRSELSNAVAPSTSRALYLSYDGMCDPLGQSQVLPYLTGLARRGHRISLISFEKAGHRDIERAAVRSLCSAADIRWYPLRYHKQPPLLSTMYDVAAMRLLAARLHRREPFDVLHCRSDLAALVGLSMKRKYGIPFIFDMRGFWADEKLEAGAWPQTNPVYRGVYHYFKRSEGEFLAQAEHVVSLTDKAKKLILERRAAPSDGPPVSMIPCCVDFSSFPAVDPYRRAGARSMLGIRPEAKVLAYLGSLGGNYMLDQMLDFFAVLGSQHSDAVFLFVTHVPASRLCAAARRKGIPENHLIVRAAQRTDVSTLLAAADLGIAFKQPSFSAKACCPTKIGEMLALELPIVTNGGVGDVTRIIEESGAGVVIDDFSDETYGRALACLTDLRPDLKRWRAAARRWFDLKNAIDGYDAIYRGVTAAKREQLA